MTTEVLTFPQRMRISKPTGRLQSDNLASIALPEQLRSLSLQIIATEALRLLATVQGDVAECARLIEAELETVLYPQGADHE